MNRLRLALLLSTGLGLSALVSTACGGISDPTKSGSEHTSTISGALTGTAVPANARVALIYRKVTTDGTSSYDGVEVASDTPVVGGKFTMNLSEPPANYFSAVFTGGSSSGIAQPGTGGGGTPIGDSTGSGTPTPAPAPAPGGKSAFGASPQLSPRGGVSGQITEDMTGAVAGFVVYADTNGNGKLDLEGPYASSPDQILGGNSELVITYLKGGGSLDYEKLRDKSGILPTAGFNLAWIEGRWLPLNDVELKLSATAKLPNTVCAGRDTSVEFGASPPADPTPAPTTSFDAGTVDTDDAGSNGYPSPTDPGLKCSDDGRSFTYTPAAVDCPPLPPAPVGLCASGDYATVGCAGRTGFGSALAAGEAAPSGWPCTIIETSSDGGSASADAGVPDGG